jgi:hypothetical protein
MVKRVFGINFFDSFIDGILTVAVPLLMLERGVDIATIGVVFAIAPFVKIFIRLASSVAADMKGERLFYVLNGASNLAQSVALFLSYSPLGFAVAKVFDGARNSFIWAVNRSSIIWQAPAGKHFSLSGMSSGRKLYFAAGSVAVFLLYPFGGYLLLLAVVGLLALISGFFSLGVKNSPQRGVVRLSDLSLRGRRGSFYSTMMAMTVGTSLYVVINFLLLPIYFSLAGFSLQDISLMYAGYFLIMGAALNYISHSKAASRRAGAVGTALFFISLSGLALGPAQYYPLFFLLMAVGDANLNLLWEHIIYLEAHDSRNKATDIGLLHVPGEIGIVAISAASGFAISLVGFAPLFLAGALCMGLYAHMSLRLIADGGK